jgi:alpha-galactosidase
MFMTRIKWAFAVAFLAVVSTDLSAAWQELPTGEVQKKAQALADLAVKEGMQGALQFCAFKDGKCIVDVWAGTMTTNAGAAKIDGDTLFPIFSTEKPLLATAVHRSVERGKLEYDKPVCKYWPEFRGGGKERLTPRLLLGYRSGLPDGKPDAGFDLKSVELLSDWKGMLDWYASCEPEIEPGTKQRYMPKSYGWAHGGLLEKAWGRPANEILREQVLVPAGIERDFFFVCGDAEIGRVATVYKGEAFETMNSDRARRSLLPSAWAVSSARGIAKFYNRLCGFDGKPPLIGRETLDAALKPCRHESDPVPDAEGLEKWHMIFGMGYGLWGGADDISRVFGHGGVGGSEGLCDRSQRLVVGYTCNFAGAPPKLREAFYSLVGMRWRYWKDDVNIQDLQMATVAKGNDASANSVAAQLTSIAGVSVDGCADVRVLQDVVTVTSTGAVSFVRLKMGETLAPEAKVLNDVWERSYGDLQWQTLGEKTIYSPWYFLAEKDGKVQGFGVETGPGAMCCWEVSAKGVTLVLDVRAGGRPVRLNGRTLKACKIVRAESMDGETPWQFGRRFCRMMCPNPKLPKEPVYGYNDWYCAYGKNTATNFLEDAAAIVSLCDGLKVRPYVVMDDGWQKNSPPVVGESGRGPWDAAGANFGMDMPEFCRRIAALGAKPGLWYRPLRAWDELPEDQRLTANRKYLDPTVPAVKARIAEDIRRFRDWGFKLVKIDFLSYDISQLWPCDPHPHHDRFIQDGRAWRDDSRTTAEVMRDLYETMKDAASDDVVIIGCNALNHLAAGVFELQRTGNDTSGKNWAWTKNHGVNTLAMRSIQDGAFFKVDADCVGLASEGAVPWALNRQWMELLGRSGTPFFVSWSRALMDDDVRAALREAFKEASEGRPTAHAEDWQTTPVPRRWSVGTFDWECK